MTVNVMPPRILGGQLQRDHPHLPVIIIEDALSSNAPHIRELEKYDCRYILGVKEGDHAFLFDWVASAHQTGRTTDLEISDVGVTHKFLERMRQ